MLHVLFILLSLSFLMASTTGMYLDGFVTLPHKCFAFGGNLMILRERYTQFPIDATQSNSCCAEE